MKILIINQHSMNHGDEAAGLALVCSLNQNGFHDITILYNVHKKDAGVFFKFENVKNANIYARSKLLNLCFILFSIYPSKITRLLLSSFKKCRYERSLIKHADYIISAPGGPSLGNIYRDYAYLWRLYEASVYNKKTAIYSPSIGPFNIGDRLWKSTQKILKNADFVSLRDFASFRYADFMNINYKQSIDTAFLNCREVNTSIDFLNLPQKYVVIVPNKLYQWHPFFIKCEKNKIDDFYRSVITRFVDNGINVILLPQIFCQGEIDDEPYFNFLKNDNPLITVISSSYDSNIQQRIIEKSDFVVGVRYHTIIFSINQSKPFYCISYENKMKNMLEILSLCDRSIDASIAFDFPQRTIDEVWNYYLRRDLDKLEIIKSMKLAKKIANETFCSLIYRLNEINK